MAQPEAEGGRISGRAALLVTVVSLVLVLALVEAASRVLLPNRFFIWPPNFSMVFDAGDNIHGIAFPTQLTINAQGMRGDPLEDAAAYRVLAVGGSTTICVYLDDEQAWPRLVQRRLNETLGEDAVWVGNVGRPGHMTREHVLQVEAMLSQHPEIDAVMLLIGINDLLRYLPKAGKSDPNEDSPDPQQIRRMAFSFYPGWDDQTPWYQRNIVARLWRMANWHPWGRERGEVQPEDEKGEFVAMMRRLRRKAARIRSRLPDLEPGLEIYIQQVNRIVDIAEQNGVEVVLITQPALWRPGLGAAETALLWAGGPPFHVAKEGATYFSVKALARAMERYNETLLAVCDARGLRCLEAAPVLPRTAEFFYDDAHFTDRGSEVLADAVAAHLLDMKALRASVTPR